MDVSQTKIWSNWPEIGGRQLFPAPPPLPPSPSFPPSTDLRKSGLVLDDILVCGHEHVEPALLDLVGHATPHRGRTLQLNNFNFIALTLT